MHVLQQIGLAVDEFWNEFGGQKNNGTGYSREEKLEALRRAAALHFTIQRGENPASRRSRFDLVKEARRNPRHSLKSHPKCFVCGGVGRERHHIVQLKAGGRNARRNLVSLCGGCHQAVHAKTP